MGTAEDVDDMSRPEAEKRFARLNIFASVQGGWVAGNKTVGTGEGERFLAQESKAFEGADEGEPEDDSMVAWVISMFLHFVVEARTHFLRNVWT